MAVAHGQMRERELEQVMQQFYHKEYNVLVCSTIIETGIDVPNANTILIERADKLGLGPVASSYGAMLVVHTIKPMPICWYLPLKVLREMRKNVWMRFSAHPIEAQVSCWQPEDLEIRGAGELLGEQQSGSMQAIGYSLYMEMLRKATKAIQKAKPRISMHHCPSLRKSICICQP